MSPVDTAWRVFFNLQRQCPLWPSTMSTCDCGRGWARGGGKCANCYEEELAAIVGPELAAQARQSLDEVSRIWATVMAAADKEAA